MNARRTIQVLYEAGTTSASEIIKLTKFPKTTVYRVLKILDEGDSIEYAPKSGRPRKVTETDRRSMAQLVSLHPSMSSKRIAAKINENRSDPISVSTVSRQLREMGYEKMLPKRKSFLTDRHMQDRRKWCIEDLNFDWSTCIFSDETCIWMSANRVRIWTKGDRPILAAPKHPDKLNVWGAISSRGVLPLYTFRENLDQYLYQYILGHYLLAPASEYFGGNWKFIQDNDPKHTANSTKTFIEGCVPEVLPWPSCSPDLNVIEHVWNIVKDSVDARRPSNILELESFVHQEWNALSINTILSLINSMPRRIQQCIEREGGHTDY